jgi:hypothetical protein
MHLCRFDQFGTATMQPICGRNGGLDFDTTCNLPLGLRVCKRCRADLTHMAFISALDTP